MKNDATVVIGAGLYGLSEAAYLKAQGIATLIFGKHFGIPTLGDFATVFSRSIGGFGRKGRRA